MKHEFTFEGILYQDMSTNRQPIYLLDDKKKTTLEKLLAKTGIIPTFTTGWDSRYAHFIPRNNAEYIEGDISTMTLTKEFIKSKANKVKITIIVEDV